MIPIDHRGNTVIVTGGCKGIGAGISKAFAQAGANVVANYRSDPEGCQAFIRSLEGEYGVQGLAVQGDVSQEDTAAALFDAAQGRFGRVDILVNNVGSTKTTYLTEIGDEEWDYYLANNLTAYFLMTREFARRNIPAGRGGQIVNVLSKAAFSTTTRGRGCYVANKTGQLGLTRATAVELSGHGIYVNAVVPGFVWTPATRALGEEFTKKLHRSPLGRAYGPEELGQAVAFMTSGCCQVMVGSVVDLSGGLMLGF